MCIGYKTIDNKPYIVLGNEDLYEVYISLIDLWKVQCFDIFYIDLVGLVLFDRRKIDNHVFFVEEPSYVHQLLMKFYKITLGNMKELWDVFFIDEGIGIKHVHDIKFICINTTSNRPSSYNLHQLLDIKYLNPDVIRITWSNTNTSIIINDSGGMKWKDYINTDVISVNTKDFNNIVDLLSPYFKDVL